MKSRTKKVLGALLIVLVAVGGYFLWRHFQNQSDDLQMADDFPMEDVYRTHELYEQDPISVKGVAQLQVDDTYTYQPDLGVIETVHVENNQQVAEGDWLFTYRQTSQEAVQNIEDMKREQTKLYNQLAKLQTDLANARTAVANAQSQLGIEEVDEEGTPEPIADPAAIESEIRDLNIQIADQDARLAQAKEGLYKTIVAKHSGTVHLNQDGVNDASVPYIRIIGEGIYINGSVNEFEYFVLGDDRVVDIHVPAEGKDVTGRMIRYDKFPASSSSNANNNSDDRADNFVGDYGGSASGNSFGFTVVPDEFIQPGFSVEMMIHIPGIAIPQDAILEEGDEKFVFVYESDTKTVKKVKLDGKMQGQTYVTEQPDLSIGTVIVMMPFDLTDGQEIKTEFDLMEETSEGMDGSGEEIDDSDLEG